MIRHEKTIGFVRSIEDPESGGLARAPIEKEFFYEKPSFAMELGRGINYSSISTRPWEVLLTYCSRVTSKTGKKIFPDFIEHVDKISKETVTSLTLPAHCGYNAIHAELCGLSYKPYIDELVRASGDIMNQLSFIHMTAGYLYDLVLEDLGPVGLKRAGRAEEEESIGCRSCVSRVHCHTHSGGRSLVGPMLVESDP